MIEWRARWEQEAASERSGYEKRTTEELLEKVQKGWFGEYYSLWRVIAEKGSLEEFGWPLMDVLRSNATYLQRYHCARSLLQLMGEKELEAVDLSGKIPGREENLEQIQEQLRQRIGPHRD